MNGPIRMYRARQVVDQKLPVSLPDCMYKLKNIHQSARNGVVESAPAQPAPQKDIIQQNNRNLPGMAELEARQEQILQQLAELKKQMDNIRGHLKVDQSSTTRVTTQKTTQHSTCPKPKLLDNIPEIVVHASSTHPPYSLHLVQKLWQNNLHLSIKCYLHSSIANLDEKAASLQRDLEEFTPRDKSSNKIDVKLIWKNLGANTELVVSHTPIIGEVNILRYLSRLCPDLLTYESAGDIYQLDSLLDASHRLVSLKTKTDRAKLLQTINKSLGKSQFLAGENKISVADLAAYSAIKQVVAPNEINVNLNKWLERCVVVS